MAKKSTKSKNSGNETEILLKKILITQLRIAGVGQKEIGKIVGISVGSVNAIARHVKVPKG
jgi:hypothetical protein